MAERDLFGNETEIAEAIDLALRSRTWNTEPWSESAAAESAGQKEELPPQIKHAIAMTVVNSYFRGKNLEHRYIFDLADGLINFWNNWQEINGSSGGFPKRNEYINSMTLRNLENCVKFEILIEELSVKLPTKKDRPDDMNMQLRVIQIAADRLESQNR